MRWETVIAFFVGLIPQKDDDMEKLYQWRWKSVALGLAGLLVGLYAASWIPGIKPAYATAETVQTNKSDVQKQLSELKGQVGDLQGKVGIVIAQNKIFQIQQTQTALLEAKRYQCRGQVPGGDRSTLDFWNQRIGELKLAWLQLTGNPWAEPDCRTF